MVPLTDEIWKSLGTAYGDDATEVAEAIQEAKAAVADDPTAIEGIFLTRIWGHVCHQGTPYYALYATIPHLVDLAAMLDPSIRARAHILGAIGYAAVNANMDVKSVGNIGHLDPRRFDCRDSLRRAAPLIAETILCDHDDDVVAHLFATLAAIKGNSDLYFEMWGLFDKIARPEGSQ